MQDSDGYIWIYTEKGISKYDGYTFKNFQEKLPNYDVWGLTEDSQGRIWVHAIHDRLVYIYQDSIHEVVTPGDIRFHINSLNETDGEIWFTSRVLVKNKGTSPENFVIRNDSVIRKPRRTLDNKRYKAKRNDDIRVTLQTKDNFLFIDIDTLYTVGYDGLIQDTRAIKDSEWVSKFNDIQKNHLVSSKRTRGDLTFFAGNLNTGILKWDSENESGQSIRYDEIYDYPVSPKYIPGYLTDSSFQITLMPAPGFLEVDLDLNVIDTFSISGLSYRRIFKDKQDNYWISTDDDGVFFITADARNTVTYTTEEDNNITRVVGNKNDDIFVGTAKGGLYALQGGQDLVSLANDAKLGNNLGGLSITNEGVLYAGADRDHIAITINSSTGEGLTRAVMNSDIQKPAKYTKTPMEINRRLNEYIKVSAYDNYRKCLWFSNGNEVWKIDFSNASSLKSDFTNLSNIDQLAIGSNGEVWAGGSGGVFRIKDGHSQNMRKVHPLFGQVVKSLAISENNILWVATEREGIFGYRNDSIYMIPDSKSAIGNDIFLDTNGFLWAATDKGILQYKIDDTNYDSQEFVRSYTINDGLLSNEINAIFVNEDYIYAGTSKGLARVSKNGKFGDKCPPVLHVQKVKINGQSVPLDSNYTLDYKDNSLEIEYAALSYKSLGAIDYQYQLTGADNSWQYTNSTILRYPNLSPGRYSLKLQATDISNRTCVLDYPINFVVVPPIWKRTWFILLSSLIAIGLLVFLYKRRIKAIIEDEGEKTRVATQIAELELKALQAQMNPHFVFNALASIRYYIQDNQPNEASDYLVRFAKLMRLFLESSKNNMASLEDEIKLITLYVEMEQLRFEKQFDFELIIQDEIKPYSMRIPTLLLQPFVENAINHGLFHKESKGVLKMKFEAEIEDVLVCTIEDNGIGRAAARLIAKQSTRGHKSRGMQIVTERLEVLKQKDNIDISLVIIDLENDIGENVGTSVKISIPLLD